MVPYASYLEPIATIPPVQTGSGQSSEVPNFVAPYTIVAHGTLPMVPIGVGISYGFMSQIGSRLQRNVPNPLVQQNVLQSNASISQSSRPTTVQEIIDRFNTNLAKQMNENYGIEVKHKTRTYQKPYPFSFDLVSYTSSWRCPDFVKFSGDDSKITWEHISQYLAQLGKATSIEEVKV